MALALKRNQLGVKVTGTNVTVPRNPKAKLMYYFSCIAKVLELDELPREFTNYGNHTALDDTKTRMLLDFCNLLSPSLLEGKCIFEVDYDLDGSPNKFLELSNTETTMVATSSVMMGGRNVQVLRVMLYRPTWRRNYYDQPLAQLTRSLEKKSSGCVIM